MAVLAPSQIYELGTKGFTLYMVRVLVPSQDILGYTFTLFMFNSDILQTKVLTLLMVRILVLS
jgi:hypothetical protein